MWAGDDVPGGVGDRPVVVSVGRGRVGVRGRPGQGGQEMVNALGQSGHGVSPGDELVGLWYLLDTTRGLAVVVGRLVCFVMRRGKVSPEWFSWAHTSFTLRPW